jgi:hypothetical protein
VIVVIAGGASIVWLFTNSGEEAERRIAVKEVEGREFGTTTDQQGCIREGLNRGRDTTLFDLSSTLENKYFVHECLKSSRPTSGFCDGVPSILKNAATEWDEKQCEKMNIVTNVCRTVLDEQMMFCDK